MPTSLTPAQQAFLRSYLGDLDPKLVDAARRAVNGPDDLSHDGEVAIVRRRFVRAIVALEFDGALAPGQARIARHLLAKGLLREAQTHDLRPGVGVGRTRTPARSLCVTFSDDGAEALFGMLAESVRATHASGAPV